MPDHAQSTTDSCTQDISELYPECSNHATNGSVEQDHLMAMQSPAMGNSAALDMIGDVGPVAPDHLLESEQDTFVPFGPPAPIESRLDPFYEGSQRHKEWYESVGPFIDEDGNKYLNVENFLIQSEDPEAWTILLARAEREWHKKHKGPRGDYPPYTPDKELEAVPGGPSILMSVADKRVSLPMTHEPFGVIPCLVENELQMRGRVSATPEQDALDGTLLTQDALSQSLKSSMEDVFTSFSFGINASGVSTIKSSIGGDWGAGTIEMKSLNQYAFRFEPKPVVISHKGWTLKFRMDMSVIKTYWPDSMNTELRQADFSPQVQVLALGVAGLALAAAMLSGAGEVALVGAAGLALIGGTANLATDEHREVDYQ